LQFTRRHTLSLAATLLGAACLSAYAAFPDKPVKIAVGFAAGGGADIVARQLGQQMGAQTGASFIVDNKPGATGTIGAAQVKRSAADVPTLAEAGVRGVDVYSWQAVVAPKGLPADVRAQLHAAIVAALDDPQVRQRFTTLGFEVVANTPEQFAAFQQAEFARWRKVIETGKITAD